MLKKSLTFITIIGFCSFLISWGALGHKTINGQCPGSFPTTMAAFGVWTDSLALHGSDADNRKNSDPSESPKHFIDIDSYSEFNSIGRIVSTYDSIVNLHGLSTVIKNGTLPWATKNTYDSLVVDFKKLNWHKAMLDASDLGHYVGDGHMPLHLASNYDGQKTGQSGVHSRYETTMVSAYITNLSNYTTEPVNLVTDVQNYIFTYIYKNQKLVDSVLLADKYATQLAGNTNSTQYTAALWGKTQFTRTLFKNASHALAELIYSAWVEAGNPPYGAKLVPNILNNPLTDKQLLVYPNPTDGKINFIGNIIIKTEVRDIAGKILGAYYDNHIDLRNLSNGVYLLNIYGKDGKFYNEKILLTK